MWKLLKATVTSFFADEALSRGAAIAFYTVTSLAPVLLIVIAIAGLVFGQEAAQNAITAQLTGLMGRQTADVLQSAIANAGGKSSGIIATIIGVVTLLATASGVFGEMQTALNKIWKAKPKSTTVSRLIRARAASLGLVAALGFLLTVSLVVSAGLTALGNYLNAILPFGGLILSVLNFIISLALMAVLFGAIYKVLPDRPIAWRDVMVGAVVTALLFTVGKSLIGWYLGSSAVASSYGAAGGLIILLFWVYYSTQIFLLGAEFTKTYATRHGSKQEGIVEQQDESHSASGNAGTKAKPNSSFDDNRFQPGPNSERHMSTTNGHEPSLAQLEREAARNRAELMGTVDALQNRISPSAIKQDVQDYVRDKKEGLLRGLEQRVRDNPLQTAAIAAGAAYPLWRIVTSMPVPLLLIGAGLALTRRSGHASVNSGEGFVHQARQRVGETTDTLKQKYEEVSDTVQQRFQQTRETVQQMADQASDRISDLKSEASENTADLSTKVSQHFSKTTDAARSMGSDAMASASETLSSGYRAGADAAARAGEQMMQAGQRTQETFVDTVQRHPMIIGAVGLAIGAAIAAALPTTRQEEQVFGAAGSALKKKAQDLASEGVEAVKGAAQEVYQDTLRQAKEQGLSSEGMQEAAKDIGDKVKTVIANATAEGTPGKSGVSSKTTSNATT